MSPRWSATQVSPGTAVVIASIGRSKTRPPRIGSPPIGPNVSGVSAVPVGWGLAGGEGMAVVLAVGVAVGSLVGEAVEVGVGVAVVVASGLALGVISGVGDGSSSPLQATSESATSSSSAGRARRIDTGGSRLVGGAPIVRPASRGGEWMTLSDGTGTLDGQGRVRVVSQELDADLVIVGAGAVGLAIAARLAPVRSVVVVEANESFGLETTSHNTGIIHAGHFYETGSAKHRFCVEGKPLLYEWCDGHGVPAHRTGKLMVAMTEDELPALERLAARAEANGVAGVERLTAEQARAVEPLVPAVAALYSQTSGVLDQYGYARSLAASALAEGAMVVYQHRVTGGSREEGGFRLELTDADGVASELRCAALVNAAGHGAPAVAAALGYPLDGAEGVPRLRQRVNRGRYFDLVGPAVSRAVSRPGYPMPRHEKSVLGHQAKAGGLGLHLSVDIDGVAHLGPDTVWLDAGAELDYSNDDSDRATFLEAGQRLLPGLRAEDLAPGQVGYRPKLDTDGDTPPDFLVWPDRGYVHLGGIESPGLTSSLAIAREVASLL